LLLPTIYRPFAGNLPVILSYLTGNGAGKKSTLPAIYRQITGNELPLPVVKKASLT
jgi:hypothetical protein